MLQYEVGNLYTQRRVSTWIMEPHHIARQVNPAPKSSELKDRPPALTPPSIIFFNYYYCYYE